MNYNQIEELILNIPKFRPQGTIEETRKFYEFLGKPGKSASMIHVAGTNGKGSTCAYMNSVLTEAGVKTGLFTSPHLVSVRERMRINDDLISEQEFKEVYIKLTGYIEDYNQSVEEYTPTFYEVLFFMAMLYFEEQKTKVIILETGLGGRLDATNVIDAPAVTILTEIGLDHMEYLGDTYEKIAEEKAGIIKKGTKVIYCANRQEVIEVIERKAKEKGVLCKSVVKLGNQDYRFVDKKIDFSFSSRYYGYIPITLSTCALYQIENAMLALTAIEELEMNIFFLYMQQGMMKCQWAGRMEEILPGIFLDGAHNEDGIEAFLTSVQEDGCEGKRWLLFSAVADKEYVNMKDKLISSKLFHRIYAAPLKNARGITKEGLVELFSNQNLSNEDEKRADANHKNDKRFQEVEVRIIEEACKGLEEIQALRSEKDLVYVVGSLYLVGEIKKYNNG